MDAPDPALVRAARQGSPDALARLFDRYWALVWRAAYAVCGRRDHASDAAQETFARLPRALAGFDPRRPLGPWLTRIAVNRAIDLLRAERRLVPLDEEADGRAAFDELPDDGLRQALARLEPGRRAVLVLHYWFDYTTPEIAELLGLPVGTVASRLSRGLADLRARLEAEHV